METGERDVLQVARVTRRAMIDDLMGRLRSGKINLRNLESQRRSLFRGRKKAHAQFVRVLGGIADDGMDQVVDELARQADEVDE